MLFFGRAKQFVGSEFLKPLPPAMEGWVLNHWTAKEVSNMLLYM